MAYVRIVLKGLHVTRRQERELVVATITLIDGIGCENSGCTMVSVERERSQRGVQPNQRTALGVHIQLSDPFVSAQERARITWATVDMVKAVLDNHARTTYEISIAAPAADEGRANVG